MICWYEYARDVLVVGDSVIIDGCSDEKRVST